jgi:prepilin-type processing-associated H-X9-DG protein
MGFSCVPTFGGMTNHLSGDWYNLGSAHPGVVNFCYADGSVRGLRIGSTKAELRDLLEPARIPADETGPNQPTLHDYWVFQQLAGFRDGGIRPDTLGN